MRIREYTDSKGTQTGIVARLKQSQTGSEDQHDSIDLVESSQDPQEPTKPRRRKRRAAEAVSTATPVKSPASKERPARLAFTPPRIRWGNSVKLGFWSAVKK